MKRTMSLMQEYRYILSSLLGLKKEIKKLEEGGIEQENIIIVPSATYSELDVTPESTMEEKQAAISAFLEGYNNDGKDVLFFEIKENPIEYNFDVTSTDWVEISEADFITNLEQRGFMNIVVNNFKNTNGRIQCILNTSAGYINLAECNITQVNIINIESLENLYLDLNQITNFNPTLPLPSGLQNLSLAYNQITDWSLSEPWANSLPDGNVGIYLGNNLTSPNGTNFKAILESKGHTVHS